MVEKSSHGRITVIYSRKQTKIRHMSKHGLLGENYPLLCKITTRYSILFLFFLYTHTVNKHSHGYLTVLCSL